MLSDTTEVALWGFVNNHPRWWLVGGVLGAIVAFRMFRMATAETRWGRGARVVILIACLFFVGSAGPSVGLPGNSALGLFAPAILLVGVWMVVEQQIGACLKAGKIRPMPWAHWFSRWSGHNRNQGIAD